MQGTKSRLTTLWAAAALGVLTWATGASIATATEPCDDFGECKVLIEINATDGDIGVHFLMDGEDLNSARLFDPNGAKVFEDQAKGPLTEQKLTETFAESAEPLCWYDAEADEEDLEDVVTLVDFLELWAKGTYYFTGMGDDGEKSVGATELSWDLPAAPTDVEFDGETISWAEGDDLGNCATWDPDPGAADGVIPVDLYDLVPGVIPNPEDVDVVAWEVVLEPDVEDGDDRGSLVYSIRVIGPDHPDVGEFDPTPFEVEVPSAYLDSLPPNTPVKVEVGAIGADDNATFTEVAEEESEYCVNEEGDGCWPEGAGD